MKKILKVITILFIILIIGFGGKFILDSKSKSANNDIQNKENDADISNQEEEPQKEEKKEEEINYLTLDVNDVKIPIVILIIPCLFQHLNLMNKLSGLRNQDLLQCY